MNIVSYGPPGLADHMIQPCKYNCRAENSFTHRHLCEFTGLDFEMAINEHYDEVMDVIDKLFVYIFNGLNGKYGMCHGFLPALCCTLHSLGWSVNLFVLDSIALLHSQKDNKRKVDASMLSLLCKVYFLRETQPTA